MPTVYNKIVVLIAIQGLWLKSESFKETDSAHNLFKGPHRECLMSKI